MAAPDGIVWGPIVNSKIRLGIYTGLSSTNDTTTISVEVWVYSKWSVKDNKNTFYFDNDATYATTSKGSVTIKHTIDTGWDTRNQTKLATYTFAYNRATTARTINCAARLTDIEVANGNDVTVSTSYTIPALPSYTISYNANGGSGAPTSQTKYYGVNLTLSTTVPTRTGYSFQGWSASSTATSASYSAGSTYTGNTNATLYAVWKANTYTVSYNANGGSGAPSNQTKTYGVNLTLSSTIPTRANYNFLGWGTSANSTSASYSAGATYTNNADITLYAVWSLAYTKPRITNYSVARCNSDGTTSDAGTYFKIVFNWGTDQSVSSIAVKWKTISSNSWTSSNISASGTSGSISSVLGSNTVSTDYSYNINLTVSDSSGSTSIDFILPGLQYSIDVLNGGKGVALFKPAEREGFDVGKHTYITGGLDVDGIRTVGNELQQYGVNTISNTNDDTVLNWKNFRTSVHFYSQSLITNQPSAWGFLFNLTGEWDIHQLWLTCGGRIYHRSGNGGGWYNSWEQLLDSTGGTVKGGFKVELNDYNQLKINNPSSSGHKNASICFQNEGNTKWVVGSSVGHDGSGCFGIWDESAICSAIRIYPNWGNIHLVFPVFSERFTILNNTINTIGCFRLNDEWIGLYGSCADAQNNSNHKGWIGHNGETNFYINNEAGGSNVSNKTWTISSDRRLKQNIEDIPEVFAEIWEEVQPKIFKWNEKNGNDGKYHFGLIAQDVIDAFNSRDLDCKDYGFVNSFTMLDDETEYFGIAYDEYHMLTSLMVKEQQKQIDNLQAQINELKQLVQDLTNNKE